MRQVNREKLMMIRGMVDGIAWVVKDACLVDALGSVVEQLDEVLEDEEGKDDQA